MRDDFYKQLTELERLRDDRSTVLRNCQDDVADTHTALLMAEAAHRDARLQEIEAKSMLAYVTARIDVVKAKIREVL